jgi:hypothetical protein
VIDLFIAFIVVFGIRALERRNKVPEFLKLFTKHQIFEDDKWRLAMTFAVIFVLQMIFISPYSLYKINDVFRRGKEHSLSLGQIITNEFYRPIFPGQRAVFKYPSYRRNIGVLADWVNDTNKSVTNTLDSMK